MAATEKVCPLNGTKCDPFDWMNKEAANKNCTFYIHSESMGGQCLYLDALKAVPKIAEGLKSIKIG